MFTRAGGGHAGLVQHHEANHALRKLLIADGSAEMRAYGRYNVNNETLRGVFADVLREWDDGVTYKVIRPDWFVVTALVNGKIHYQKTMLRRDVFKTFQIEYDASRRATYDAVTARIAKSFIG